MKTAIILSIFLVCVIALVVADTTDILPPSPSSVRERAKVIPPESLSVSPNLQEVRERPKVVLPESSVSVSPLPDVQERAKVILPESGLSVQPLSPVQEIPKNIAEDKVLGIPSFQSVQSLEPTTPPYQPLEAPSFNEVVPPQIAELNDFSGGLNLVSFPTHIAKNEAKELENALWNPQGEMYKRPGYSEHSTPPEVFNFLYRYYQQDGDKWTMGGSDTALYYLHEDSSNWTYLIGTGGTSGRWDGTTFEDMFVGTHEGIEPVVWNGSTFVTMGTSIDSFQVEGSVEINIGYATCMEGSTRVDFDVKQTSWDASEWVDYMMGFWAYREISAGVKDTFYKYQIVMANSADDVHINHIANYEGGILNDSYARFYSWFGIDSIWREGTIDGIATCAELCSCAVQIYDSTYYWDSTFTYDNYIFEITAGEGKGIKRWMNSYGYWVSSYSACNWDTLAFMLPGYTAGCFEVGSHYRIYTPAFVGKGAKFCETWEGAIWVGWSGIGDEQNKNIVNWSGVDDLGKWDPDHHIIIESDDGDYITGMAKFPGEYTDIPRQEMIVTKNNSFYKIVPTSDGYDFWLIQGGVGCVSNSAISPAEGLLLFPDQHGVWAYDKREPTCISKKIDPIFEGWNTENLEDVSGIYNPQDRHYYMSYPEAIGGELGKVVVVWEDDRNDPLGDIYAQVYIDYDSIVGSNILVCDAKGASGEDTFQIYPDVASDANGDFVVVWVDMRNQTWDVYGRLYYANGTPKGGDFLIADVTADDYGAFSIPSVSMYSDGRFVVTWDQTQGTDDIYLYGKKYTADGQLLSTTRLCDECDKNCYCCTYPCSDACPCPDGVCCCGTCECCGAWNYNMNRPCVGVCPDNTYTAVWSADRHPAINWENICGNFFNECSQRMNVCDTHYSSSETNSIEPCIAPYYNGGFVLCWTEQVNDFDVYKGAGVVVNDNTTGAQRYPRTDVEIDNGHVIVWEDARSGTAQIYGQRYDSDGDAVGTNFVISDSSTATCEEPDIAMDADGDFVVVWVDLRDGGSSGNVYFRRYDSTGTIVGSTIKVNDDVGIDDQSHVRVALSKGEYSFSYNNKTLAWNIDHQGWSKESFCASAFCYQHSTTDEVKILFADPEIPYVYNYGTQADDVDEPVILTYQSPYFRFSPYPWQRALVSYATIESYGDGEVILSWYSDYGTLIVEDTLIVSGHDLQTIDQNGVIEGENISLKITTSADLFKLAGYYLEYLIDKSRR